MTLPKFDTIEVRSLFLSEVFLPIFDSRKNRTIRSARSPHLRPARGTCTIWSSSLETWSQRLTPQRWWEFHGKMWEKYPGKASQSVIAERGFIGFQIVWRWLNGILSSELRLRWFGFKHQTCGIWLMNFKDDWLVWGFLVTNRLGNIPIHFGDYSYNL